MSKYNKQFLRTLASAKAALLGAIIVAACFYPVCRDGFKNAGMLYMGDTVGYYIPSMIN